MNKAILHFYVSYSDYGAHPIHIGLLSKSRYDDLKQTQPTDDRIYRATIHIDSTRTGDPIIDIIAVSKHQRLGEERAKQINQEVIIWLMDNGYMPKR